MIDRTGALRVGAGACLALSAGLMMTGCSDTQHTAPLVVKTTGGYSPSEASAARPASASPVADGAPTCEQLGDAVRDTYGMVSSIEDDTAGAQAALAEGGKAPYEVLRGCDIHVADNSLPLSIVVDSPGTTQLLEARMQAAAARGGPASIKLAGADFGELAYETSQQGGGSAVNAVADGMSVSVTTPLSAEDAENITRKVITLL